MVLCLSDSLPKSGGTPTGSGSGFALYRGINLWVVEECVPIPERFETAKAAIGINALFKACRNKPIRIVVIAHKLLNSLYWALVDKGLPAQRFVITPREGLQPRP